MPAKKCAYCDAMTPYRIAIEGSPTVSAIHVCPDHVGLFKEHVNGMSNEAFRIAFGRPKPETVERKEGIFFECDLV